MTAWEQGRLHGLIQEIAAENDLGSDALIGILTEAEVLTALNMAEVIKTKLEVIRGLERRVRAKEFELAVRDYIAKHPWLISPTWETFKVEKGVDHVLKEARTRAGIDGEDYKGRIDLALSSGKQLLVMEFMRPGLTIDWDHVNRLERYVRHIRELARANTAGQFRAEFVSGNVVADKIANDGTLVGKIADLESVGIRISDWETLLAGARKQWEEFLSIQAERAPTDARVQAVAKKVSSTPTEPEAPD